MARDDANIDDEKSLLDRRSYLQLAGTAAATAAGIGATATSTAGASSDLLLHEDFEGSDYTESFTHDYKLGVYDGISSDRSKAGSSSLEVRIPKDEHYGMDAKFDAARAGKVDGELGELYVQYYVLFPESFNAADDGKMAGFGNVENGDGGYGGTPSTGENGWSARVGWEPTNGDIELAYYTYHMDMSGSYGDWYTATTIPKGQWVKIDQYIKMNTVSDGSANADGQLKMWVDDSLELEKTGMRFSSDPTMGPNIYFCVYHGGGTASPEDNAIYFDGLKASQSEITDGSTDEPKGTVLELISDDSASDEPYEFTVDGNVTRRITSGPNSAEKDDSIVDNGDGTVTVSDNVGNGYGDSFYVDGSFVSMKLDESMFTIRYGGEEVTVADLTGDSSGSDTQLPNTLVIDGTNKPNASSKYEFTVSGDIEKSAELGTINGDDTIDGSTASGRVVGGKDGYRFSGEVTNFSLHGPATVNVQDDA